MEPKVIIFDTDNENHNEYIKNNVNDKELNIVFPYECDVYQKYACSCVMNNENVLVTAHTGTGKTTVAIFAMFFSLFKKNGRCVYITPIKALSNDKYKELKKTLEYLNEKFDTNYTIGISTGDITINPMADIVIMTAEILQNALYKLDTKTKNNNESETKLPSFDFTDSITNIVIDEVHYINDDSRGTVWEEIIVIVDPKIQLTLLSATISNQREFAQWIMTAKNKNMHLISTTFRVVPLIHYIYVDDKIMPIMQNGENNFSTLNFKNAKDIYIKANELRAKNNKNPQTDFSIMSDFVTYVKNNNYLQSIIFSFSRKGCEKYAKSLNLSEQLVTREEVQQIKKIFDKNMYKYKNNYENKSQYIEIQNLVQTGICYHHSGLLPILKEIIEILFNEGLIKVLFATETFAVGVNMPTRLVAYTSLQKNIGGKMRYLTPTEYKQMSGRAGRRGKDTVGHVVILPLFKFPDETDVKNILTGTSQPLKSKFNQNYSFHLKIALSCSTNVSDFFDKSLFNIDNSKLIKTTTEKIHMLTNKHKLLKEQIDDTIDVDTYILIQKYDEVYADQKNMEQELGVTITLSKKQLKEQKQIKKKTYDIKNFNEKYLLVSELNDINHQTLNLEKKLENDKNILLNHSSKIIKLLMHYDFIAKTDKLANDINKSDVTIKGTLAAQINDCNCLLLTEVITQQLLCKLTPIEIVQVLSIFIDDTVTNNDALLSDIECSIPVKNTIREIQKIANEYLQKENELRVYYEGGDTFWNIKFNYMASSYMWANGDSLQKILNVTDVYEGNFVKNMLKLNKIVTDIANLCVLNNDIGILPTLEKIESLIMRDVVNVDSLYL
jgi:superfamily II RNA helicase